MQGTHLFDSSHRGNQYSDGKKKDVIETLVTECNWPQGIDFGDLMRMKLVMTVTDGEQKLLSKCAFVQQFLDYDAFFQI